MARNIDSGGGSYLTATNTGVNFTSEMTIAVWARLDATGGYLFARSNNSPQRYCFGIWSASTSYGAFLGNGSFSATHVTGVVDPRPGIWEHIVFRVTGGTGMSLYVNGKLDAAATSAHALTTSVDPLTFGGWANHGAGEAMNGQLGSIAVWNRALDYEQIVDLYLGKTPGRLLPGNLRGWWTLDDGGSLEIDRSVFACHATPTAASPVPRDEIRVPYYLTFGAVMADAGDIDVPFITSTAQMFDQVIDRPVFVLPLTLRWSRN